MFADYEVVKLTHDLPEYGMKAGTHGTIVMVHHAPTLAYEVELTDKKNGNWAVVTLKDEDLASVTQEELYQDEAA